MFSKIFRTMHSIVDCFDAIELCQLNVISEKKYELQLYAFYEQSFFVSD